MGIPGLISTLEPFAQRVAIGESKDRAGETDEPVPSIKKVVIDGPSLVHYVYNNLYSHAPFHEQPWISQPGYAEISHAVLSFIRFLQEELGVRVLKIFFDGGLPLSKRPVRMERLEAGRAKVVALRRQCQGPFRGEHTPSATETPDNPHQAAGEGGLEKMTPKTFLEPTRPAASSLSRLPAPPFMVAATIELLRKELNKPHGSQDPRIDQLNTDSITPPDSPQPNFIVEQVDGEADGFCAAEAARTGALILTSDSDLLAYDLGDEGSVILLNSLEHSTQPSSPGSQPVSAPKEMLTGMMYQKGSLCSQMGIPNTAYQLFCFYRLHDHELSTRTIVVSCNHLTQSPELEASFKVFQEAYSVHRHQLGFEQNLQCLSSTEESSQNLDPVLSELLVEMSETLEGKREADRFSHLPPMQKPFVYLPTMLEDPDRDSAWSYGEDIRSLAYTLLAQGRFGLDLEGLPGLYVEHRRRGNRVSGAPVPGVDSVDALNSIVVRLIQTYRVESHRILKSLDATAHRRLTPGAIWKVVGINEVNIERLIQGKPEVPATWVQRYVLPGQDAYTSDTWDEIHTQASVNAVLYSLRMLKQSLQMRDKVCADEESDPIPVLAGMLKSLPSIPTLMSPEDPNPEPQRKASDPKSRSRSPERRESQDSRKSPCTPETLPKSPNQANKKSKQKASKISKKSALLSAPQPPAGSSNGSASTNTIYNFLNRGK